MLAEVDPRISTTFRRTGRPSAAWKKELTQNRMAGNTFIAARAWVPNGTWSRSTGPNRT